MGEQADRLARGEWYLDDEELQQRRRDCWAQLDSFNGAGVTIGRNSVIGAGSVVLDDIPDHVVAVGVPAKVVRTTPFEGDSR